MSTATQRIRAAVCLRADGSCESCGHWVGLEGEDGHMDHAFGRAKVPQDVANCWLLCIACDNARTNNRPDAATWLMRFARHATRHGYAAEYERAAGKLQVLAAKGRA